ncbi:hypothetical protein NL108_013265, partial [Boleophthalmus pectinirostris]
FPLSKPQLSTKWVSNLGLKNFVPTPNTCLCSEHFRADCFRDYNGKQFLREDAVPTLYTHGHEGSRIELRKRGVPSKDNPPTQAPQQAVRSTDPRREKRGGGRVCVTVHCTCLCSV